jgi:hypothetical protein
MRVILKKLFINICSGFGLLKNGSLIKSIILENFSASDGVLAFFKHPTKNPHTLTLKASGGIFFIFL